MDRITKSLLEEFSKDSGFTHLSDEKQFEHLAAYLTAGRHVGESINTEDVVTGSGADTGIDAIATIVNGALVSDPELVEELSETNGYLDASFVFVQAERSPSFDAAKIGTFTFGVVDFFSDAPKLPRNEAIKASAEVMTAILTRASKFKRGNPTCRLYYVTTGTWTNDPALEARRKASIEDLQRLNLFREVEFIPVDASSIQKLYQQAKNAISRDFVFAEKTVIPEIKGVNEAYLGLLPASDFLHLIEEDDGELIKSIFYDNVRDWQDYNTVNTEIRDTLSAAEMRSRFALMNNGITLIAKTMRSTGNKIHLEDYQVVNGCQTSHVLHDQREHLDPSVFVPLRIICTRDEAIIASIIKATNRQTEVKEEQLIALSDFQKKLEQYFQTFSDNKKLFYERRSRQFNSVQGVEKTRIVTPGNLIRAYASMFRDEPHRTTRTYRALLANVGSDIFGANHRLEPYYAAAYALYCLEYFFRSQVLDAKYKPARWHILLAVRILLNPNPPPRPNSHEMERYADGLMQTLWEPDKANKVFQEAAAALDKTAQGNSHRDHIRTEPFTDSLKQACGSASSVTMANKALARPK